MCGIAGAFSFSGEFVNEAPELKPVLDRMVRRGPDGSGISRGAGWLLGHRRLAIIDLQGGVQPFEDSSGWVLSYNGELYNYRELREELASAGCHFRTQSDTEVVLRAWMHWGPDCLKRFNGMFAFALYNPVKDVMYLARDQVGIKPLFYGEFGGTVYFASSMAALLAFREVPAVMDEVGVSHYLSTAKVVLGSRTLVKGVSTLEAGCYLQLSRGAGAAVPEPCRYWELPEQSDECGTDHFARKVEQVQELVSSSIGMQLVSDVPLGGFLSGGIDSTVIASRACPLSGGHFNAYSVGYERESVFGESYHEWPYIREAAQAYGMQCREIVLEENDYPDDWRFLIQEKGLPLSTPNEVGIYRLASALKQDYTVALSGEGADEVFGGYIPAYFSVMDYERSKLLGALDDADQITYSKALRRMYGTDNFSSLPDHFFRVASWMNLGVKFDLLKDEVKAELKDDEDLLLHYLRRFEQLKGCSPFDTYMRIHFEKNLENLLYRLDSSTMAASVEGRVPFTDPRLVELLYSLPDAYKMDWFDDASEHQARTLNVTEADLQGLISSKILLRAAFGRDIPQRILTRRKMSFPVPFREWFAGPMKALVEEQLRGNEWIRSWFREDRIEVILDRLDEANYALLVWPLLNLCLWQESMGVSWE